MAEMKDVVCPRFGALTAPHATTATKLRSMQVAGAFVDDGVFRDLVHEHAVTRRLPEAAEGLDSFHEKRKPAWYREK